ncbi:peptidoglycan/LPS O-acetylase OafA/YrhL [Arcicella aurantiaca]|uniref:Peptidoglycan/LPS O-acetylase OafA/YrhL n=1 Tax=Arcicella aurantiaca TaxID=591202 RepID=A0A316E817_9BACT|nr:acyltransferase [Arcicella aurantiaca]PWK26511.1 peptidoglycan/LPS O-acetylase OafA/YrhL [Arcicella aurantiaca]
MSSKKIINSIQFLRGFAALAVVIHHTGGYVKRYYEPHLLLGDFFSIGFAGVDLFFVISGFIIHFTSKNYLNNPAKLKDYLSKRFVRVYPIYWIVTTLLFTLGWLITHVLHKNVFSIGYPHTIIAYLQTYSLFPLHFAINPVTWTLSYEIFFYVVFALLIISKRLIIIPFLILLVSFYNIFIQKSGSELTYFNFIFSGYNFEFVLGCLIFQFYEKVQLSKALSLILLTVAISIIIYFGYEVSDVDSFQRVLTFGLPSGLILLTLLNLEKDGVISFPKIFLMLGDASYALYLIHFPMMLLMNKIPQMLGYKFTATQEINYSYLIIISIVITSFFVHKWIEKPIAKFILK